MPDKAPMEIKVSRIIPAQKWRVIRLLTRVCDFPSYIPTVREAAIIEKRRNEMKTRWFIRLDNIPIRWVAEDTLDLKNNKINFKAIDGDLDEFYGTWSFRSCAEGTEVSVHIYLSVSIPAIQDFAEGYIKKAVSRNFEAILEALERRAISNRYASYRRGDKEKISGFGIIGHFYNFNHLSRCLKLLNPDFKMPSREFIDQLFNITPSFKLYDLPNFTSKAQESTHGCFIIATFIPDMLQKDLHSIFGKVVRACKIAEKNGVGIVSLGGFTSIVSEKIGQQVANEVDVPVTSGNSFGVAMALEGILKATQLTGLDIAAAKLAVIGATSDIGSGCARVLAGKVKELTICGSQKENLKKLQRELATAYRNKAASTDNPQLAVSAADIVIAAENSSASFLDINWFKPGAIICDLGYPKNLAYLPYPRRDVLAFCGGLTKLPSPVDIPMDIGLSSPYTLYGPYAEAIILALEKRFEEFSSGNGNITPDKVREISALGKKHGFEAADLFWADKQVDPEIIDTILRLRKA